MTLKSRFCAKCGVSTDKLADGLCAECFLANHVITIPKKTSIRHCTICNSVWLGGIWIKAEEPLETYLMRRVIERIKLPRNTTITDAEIKKLGAKGKLKLLLRIGNSEIEKEYITQLTIEKFCCPECSRENSTSYLAIVQIRTDKDVEAFVKKASRMFTKKAKLIKAEERKQGIDLYLDRKDIAKSVAMEARKRLNCKMTLSSKQHGWDKIRSKPLTKLTILLRER